jgi:hypothetical protein
MKQSVSTQTIATALGVLALALVCAWYLLSGPSQAAKEAGLNRVAHHLSEVHGDVSKLSRPDQDFVRSHPHAFEGAIRGNVGPPQGSNAGERGK